MDMFNYLSTLPPQVQMRIAKVVETYSKQYKALITPNKRSQVKAAKACYRAVDDLVKEHFKQPNNTHNCKEGCSHCCHLFIFTTCDEALTIFNYCNANNIDIDKTRLEKQQGIETEEWTRTLGQHSKCVFLGDNDRCRIYPVRPIVCRKYYVASPPHLCDVTKGVNQIATCNIFDAELLSAGILEAREHGNLADQLLKLL